MGVMALFYAKSIFHCLVSCLWLLMLRPRLTTVIAVSNILRVVAMLSTITDIFTDFFSA
jgi:hypothetical protein